MKTPVCIEKGQNSVDLHICWSLHNACNYKCSYCPSYNRDASQKWLQKEHVFKFIDAVCEYYVKQLRLKRIQISFTGGEPNLWESFKDICRYIVNKGMTIGITSNGSLMTDYWKDFAHLFDWICLSYHPEFVNDRNFYNLVNYMHDKPDIAIPAIRFMMLSEKKYWDKCIAFADSIKSTMSNWSIEFVKIQDDFGKEITPVYYDKAQVDFLRLNGYEEQHGRLDLIRPTAYFWDLYVIYNTGQKEKLRTNDLINRDLATFNNWRCNIGLELLCIDYYGNITPSGCLQDRAIGRISQDDAFVFPDTPVICKKQRCNCGTEIMVSKNRDNYGNER